MEWHYDQEFVAQFKTRFNDDDLYATLLEIIETLGPLVAGMIDEGYTDCHMGAKHGETSIHLYFLRRGAKAHQVALPFGERYERLTGRSLSPDTIMSLRAVLMHLIVNTDGDEQPGNTIHG